MKFPDLQPGALVRVRWEDAYATTETWIKDQDFNEAKHGIQAVYTVGYVWRRTRRQVILAQSIGVNDAEVGSTMAIALPWISEVKVLALPPEPVT